MQQSQGFSKLTPSLIALIAVGAFVVGTTVLDEQASPTRIAAAGLMVGGLVLMKLSFAQ